VTVTAILSTTVTAAMLEVSYAMLQHIAAVTDLGFLEG